MSASISPGSAAGAVIVIVGAGVAVMVKGWTFEKPLAACRDVTLNVVVVVMTHRAANTDVITTTATSALVQPVFPGISSSQLN